MNADNLLNIFLFLCGAMAIQFLVLICEGEMSIIKKLLRAVLPAKRRRRLAATTKRELLVRLLRDHLQAAEPAIYDKVANEIIDLLRVNKQGGK